MSMVWFNVMSIVRVNVMVKQEPDMVTFSLLARTVNIKPAGKLESWTRTRGLGPRVRQVKSNQDAHIIKC
jgi:hypothetical protein